MLLPSSPVTSIFSNFILNFLFSSYWTLSNMGHTNPSLVLKQCFHLTSETPHSPSFFVLHWLLLNFLYWILLLFPISKDQLPQASFLGPLLYILSFPNDLIQSHDFKYSLYATDPISLLSPDMTLSWILDSYIISIWMPNRDLKYNMTRTGLLIPTFKKSLLFSLNLSHFN